MSPTLYGLMTEEINYSYDGGLYAELVRNRTFRSDWSGILNWFLIEKGTSSAKIERRFQGRAIDGAHQQRETRGHQGRRQQPGRSAQRRLLGNRRASERPVHRSFFAKSDSEGPLPVKVALVADQSGQVLASASVPVAGTAWKEYKFEMQSGNAAASSENHLELTIDRPATLWLQLVSALPADLSRPAKRQPHRHHGEAGRHASRVPALPRRQLPGRQTASRPASIGRR